MLNTILTGDCHELLKTLPDKSVNMVLCDPPYGTTALEWDAVLNMELIWAELKRVCLPNAAIVFTASQPFTTDLICTNRKWFRYHWVWPKARATMFQHAKRMPMKAHEEVVVFYRTLPTYNPQLSVGKPFTDKRTFRTTDITNVVHPKSKMATLKIAQENLGTRYPTTILPMLDEEIGNESLHPTQKPVSLFGYLILTYTNPGDTVLDFTAGSGTTGVACKQHGRNFILIEREPKYVAIAERRISEVQPNLFQQAA